MNLTGTFQIQDWQEAETKTLSEGRKFTSATVKQEYAGDIKGTSEVHYQMFYSASGNAMFNGYEVLEGEVDGVKCELTISHNGKFEQGVASSEFKVIECLAKPSLLGLEGSFKSGEAGQASYSLGK